MAAIDSVKAKLDEYEYLLKLQMQKIEELAAENARLTAACDAHGVLKSIYLDPNASQTNRVKAASAALPHETPKLMPERAPLELKAEEVVVPLKELVKARMERQNRLEGLPWQAHLSGATAMATMSLQTHPRAILHATYARHG